MELMNRIVFVFLLWLFLVQGLFAGEYKVAVRAIRGIDHAIKQWQPTIDVLNEELPGYTFTLIPILNLDEIIRRAGQRDFDFVLTNPSSFVEIEQKYEAKALTTLNNKRANTAQSRFGSVIFTHVKNEDIIAIKNLKNKTLMAVSEQAFGGWRVSWLEMLEQGFDPYNDLKALVFSESTIQYDVVKAVLDGKADVGVVRSDLLERMEVDGKIDMRYLRIINNIDIKDFPFFLSTKLYPEWAFAALKHVPTKHSLKVSNTLMKISENSQAAQLGHYVGWIMPRDYDSVRNLMKRLKVGSYAH